jgi:hypothetical protein
MTANGELTKRQQSWLKDLDIPGVRIKTIKDDDRNKIEMIEVETEQSPQEDYLEEGFRIHIVVQLTDAKKKTYLADFTGNRPGDLDVEYTGEDYWKLYLPHGDLDHPKVTAYAIEYGFMDEETFVPFAENLKRVKTLKELTEQPAEPYPGTMRLYWYYMYDDEDSGVTEQTSQSIKQIQVKAASADTASKAETTSKGEP